MATSMPQAEATAGADPAVHQANAPRRDEWARDYNFFTAPQEKVDYIRTIDSYEKFAQELQKATESSGSAKKIGKVLSKLDGPLKRYQSLARAVRAASHDSDAAQSAIWGGLLVVLTWSFSKTDYLTLIVDLLARMGDALPDFDPHLEQLAKRPGAGNPKEAIALKEFQEPVRSIYLNVTEFTHSTAATLWLKLGFSSSLPVGGISRRMMQTMTMPFFKKTLAEDFETNFKRVQDQARRFERATK